MEERVNLINLKTKFAFYSIQIQIETPETKILSVAHFWLVLGPGLTT